MDDGASGQFNQMTLITNVPYITGKSYNTAIGIGLEATNMHGLVISDFTYDRSTYQTRLHGLRHFDGQFCRNWTYGSSADPNYVFSVLCRVYHPKYIK